MSHGSVYAVHVILYSFSLYEFVQLIHTRSDVVVWLMEIKSPGGHALAFTQTTFSEGDPENDINW